LVGWIKVNIKGASSDLPDLAACVF